LEIADRLQVAEGGPSLALAWAGADRPTESDRQRLRVSAREGRPREPTLLLLGEKGEVYSISCTVSLVTTHYCRHRALSQAKPKATRSRSSHADQPSSSHKIRLPTTPLELRPAPALPFHRDTFDTFHPSSTTSLPALCLNVPHVHHAAHVSVACLGTTIPSHLRQRLNGRGLTSTRHVKRLRSSVSARTLCSINFTLVGHSSCAARSAHCSAHNLLRVIRYTGEPAASSVLIPIPTNSGPRIAVRLSLPTCSQIRM